MSITHVDLKGEEIVKKTKKRRYLKILLGVLIFIVVFSFLGAFYVYPKTKTLSADAATIADQTKMVRKAVESQDVPGAKKSVAELKATLQKTESDLSRLAIVGKLPLINGYYNDTRHALRAGVLGAEAGELVADSILPFGDILGLKDVKSNLKAEEKVQVLVTKVLPSLTPKTDRLEQLLKEIKTEIDQIKPGRYPDNFTVEGFKVKESLIATKKALDQVEYNLPAIKDALEVLPSVLGYREEKTYLLLFQNDKELRPTGGFITSYAIANIKNGKLLDIKSDDIYHLDQKFTPIEAPPETLQKYLLLKIFPIRDSNLSPDYKISAEKFNSFYQTIPSMPKVDGIIAIDTEFVRMLMEITGPITVAKYNETFSAEINPDYKIPDVIYKLELYAERVLSGAGRKGVIGDLMDGMISKLLSAKPEKFPKIFDTFREAAEQKHVLFYFPDIKAQGLAEELNYAGRIRNFDGDYLHVNNANFAGLKGNLYIKASVEQDITISESGAVTKKVKITLRNTERADGWLNSVYQNWMRLYVPKGSRLIEKEVFRDFAEKDELGKTVWESFSRTLPLDSSDTVFTYELPFKVKKGETYKMLIQKQPGTTDPHMIIRLNGKKIKEFDLKKDKEIEFKVL